MKNPELTTCEKMLFALLRAALHDETPDVKCFENVSSESWRMCYRLAARQGVLIMAWDAVVKLPEVLQPSTDLKISWALAVEKYEAKYELYCRAVLELSDYYEQQGVRLVLLKGVGFSAYYPVPSHREGGDIDIYTMFMDNTCCDGIESNEFVNMLMEKIGVEVDRAHSAKHSCFYYNGIPVENHKCFLDVDIYDSAREMELLLEKIISPCKVELLPDGYVYVPSIEFNTVFIAFHAAQHYGAGLALHHLCDWACLIKKYGLNIPSCVTDKYFINGINAFTYLCNNFLGTSVPVSGCEKLASEIINEILHPYGQKKCPATASWWQQFKFKIEQYKYLIPINNSILHVPLWRNPCLRENIKSAIVWKLSRIALYLKNKR